MNYKDADGIIISSSLAHFELMPKKIDGLFGIFFANKYVYG